MIPAIGLMVGCYILVRMLALLTQPPERRAPLVVRGAALLTLFLTVAVLVALWVGPAPTLR